MAQNQAYWHNDVKYRFWSWAPLPWRENPSEPAVDPIYDWAWLVGPDRKFYRGQVSRYSDYVEHLEPGP